MGSHSSHSNGSRRGYDRSSRSNTVLASAPLADATEDINMKSTVAGRSRGTSTVSHWLAGVCRLLEGGGIRYGSSAVATGEEYAR